ncbi:Putative glycerophosphoryl diester phosphodiesterase [Desulfonema limicola]|uniref:Glycerophosphoryl diester phosphodiesterase n=1 Tax=Desulfonema limicola TaxID=45656 RepID=A0A975BEA2_9BACT|nr:glycerophosphodiester phosphodiesterase family protein [Desulfonema limicola]QTA83690.1 Putative glycerophosphoryl diester phosphodiesterase [Desulfonema limicola]
MITNIAHRGASSIAPENTLMAAAKALKTGADIWETDLAVTKDEQLMLFHDDDLIRTTDVQTCFPGQSHNNFTEFTFKEIQKLDAGSWFVKTDPFGQIAQGCLTEKDIKECRTQKVPLLEHALIFTKDNDFCMNLELKILPPGFKNFPVPEKVLAMLRYVNIKNEQIIISSFNHKWLREIKTLNPKLRIQALISESENEYIVPDWNKTEFKTFNIHNIMFTDNILKSLKKNNINFNIWVVNEKQEMQDYIKAGASGIITDFPQRLQELKNHTS